VRIVSIGEILWDVFPDRERLGGAAFNFSANAAKLGHEVMFVSAVGDDSRGADAMRRAREFGVRTDLLRVTRDYPTGIVEVSVDAAGQPRYRLARPSAYDAAELSDGDLGLIRKFAPDWIYYGTLHQIYARPREATRRLLEAAPGARRFYDVNLRPDAYGRELVLDLLAAAGVAKLNEDEAAVLASWASSWAEPPIAPSLSLTPSAGPFCEALARRFMLDAVCVTRGAHGCALFHAGAFAEIPVVPVEVVDTVGAGDAFAAAFLDALHAGLSIADIGVAANAAGARAAGQAGAVA
jgi:fructokinase